MAHPSAGTSLSVANVGRSVARSGFLAGVVAFLAYISTLAPGVYGFDSAELATGAYTLGIVHPTGYPFYLVLSRLFMYFPVGDIAYRANLLSAVLGALSVALVFRLIHRLTNSPWAPWIASLGLAFAIGYWRMAIVAEVYTLQTTLVGLLLVSLLEYSQSRNGRWLALAGLVYGLSLTNHFSSALYAPALGYVLLRETPGKNRLQMMGPFAAGVLIGLLPYAYFPLRGSEATALNYVRAYYGIDLRTVSGMVWMATGQAYRFFVFGYDLAGYTRELGDFAYLLWRNFTGLGILLGAVGWWGLRRRFPFLAITSWLFIVTAVFVAGYAVQDKDTMYLPALLVGSVWIGFGFDTVFGWFRQQRARWVVPARLGLLTSVVLMVLLAAVLNRPEVDLSQAEEAKVFAFYTLESVEPNAVIIGGWSPAVILEYYQQVEGRRQDVTIINRSRYEVAQYYREWVSGTSHEIALSRIQQAESDLVRSYSGARPVYDVHYDTGLADEFEYKPVGGIFRLFPRVLPITD